MYLYDEKTKLCYAVFPGNASRTHKSFFIKAGWKSYAKFNDVPAPAILFSHIQEPKERMVKGVASILYQHNLNGYVDDKLLKLLCHCYTMIYDCIQ